jgi:hypothetical protein
VPFAIRADDPRIRFKIIMRNIELPHPCPAWQTGADRDNTPNP